MNKTCNTCHLAKPLSHFHKNKGTKDGYGGKCKLCCTAYSAQYYIDTAERRVRYNIDNEERHREWMERWRLNNPVNVLLHGAKRRAKKHGIPFDITVADIERPTQCPVFGIELDYRCTGTRRQSPNSATLDRVIPSLGYVKGNVMIIRELLQKSPI